MTQPRENSKVIVGISEMPYDLLIEPKLTVREQEILSNITSPDKIIAHLLNISIRTVVNHSVSIRRKTGCKSKAELAEYAAYKYSIN